MSFPVFWSELQARLKVEAPIKNWTLAKGFLGDIFRIAAVTADGVKVDSPRAKNLQHIQKGDFEVMYNNWDAYCSGKLRRQELRDLTRFSKYTISIIKYLEDASG